MAQYSSSLPTNTPSATDVNDALHICSGSAVKWPQGDPCSLRVIGHVLQGCAEGCKCRIVIGISFPCLAECCTVLPSQWYQSGIRTSDSYSLTAGPMARTRALRSHNPPTLVSVCCRTLQKRLK
jgi:hypothetical protein